MTQQLSLNLNCYGLGSPCTRMALLPHALNSVINGSAYSLAPVQDPAITWTSDVILGTDFSEIWIWTILFS